MTYSSPEKLKSVKIMANRPSYDCIVANRPNGPHAQDDAVTNLHKIRWPLTIATVFTVLVLNIDAPP
jgi:hypothetical protein